MFTHGSKGSVRLTRGKNRCLVAESQGKYIAIQGDRVAGIWDTYGDCLKAAYAEFGLTPFLIQQILEIEPVHFFT